MGIKTDSKTRVVAITGPVISSMAFIAASRGSRLFSSIFLTAFSTTIIASSTTIPIAKTNPKSDNVFILTPKAAITANVPISDTGIAIVGIRVALQSSRNKRIVRKTKITDIKSVSITSFIEDFTNVVVSNGILAFIP